MAKKKASRTICIEIDPDKGIFRVFGKDYPPSLIHRLHAEIVQMTLGRKIRERTIRKHIARIAIYLEKSEEKKKDG